MAEHSLWRFSRALHSAINERQPEDLETQIDDDVDWVIYGPIELFPFLGARRGKAAVLEVCRQISENVRVHRFDRESIMLSEDSFFNRRFVDRFAVSFSRCSPSRPRQHAHGHAGRA